MMFWEADQMGLKWDGYSTFQYGTLESEEGVGDWRVEFRRTFFTTDEVIVIQLSVWLATLLFFSLFFINGHPMRVLYESVCNAHSLFFNISPPKYSNVSESSDLTVWSPQDFIECSLAISLPSNRILLLQPSLSCISFLHNPSPHCPTELSPWKRNERDSHQRWPLSEKVLFSPLIPVSSFLLIPCAVGQIIKVQIASDLIRTQRKFAATLEGGRKREILMRGALARTF